MSESQRGTHQMTIEEVFKLKAGDEVFWNDPDGGICSRYVRVMEVEFVGDILCLTDNDGITLECFPYELS